MVEVTSVQVDVLGLEQTARHVAPPCGPSSSRDTICEWLSIAALALLGSPLMANGQVAPPPPSPSSAPSFPVEFATTRPVQVALTGQQKPSSKLGFVERQAAALAVGCFGPQHGRVLGVSPRVAQSNGFALNSIAGSFDADTRCWQVVADVNPLECSTADTSCLAAWPVVEIIPVYPITSRVLQVIFQNPPGPAPNRECPLTRATVVQPVCETERELFAGAGLPQAVQSGPYGPSGELAIGAGPVGSRCLEARLATRQPAIDVPGYPFGPYRYFCTGAASSAQYGFPMFVWREAP